MQVQIPNIALFVIDCSMNMDTEMVSERAVPLVQFLRAHLPATTPIVMAEDTTIGSAWTVPATFTMQSQRRAALRTAYETLIGDGVKGLFYVNGVH